jgi:hypothetical protein
VIKRSGRAVRGERSYRPRWVPSGPNLGISEARLELDHRRRVARGVLEGVRAQVDRLAAMPARRAAASVGATAAGR